MSNLNVPDKFYCYENYIGISGSSAFFSHADVITTDVRETVTKFRSKHDFSRLDL